MVEEKATAVAQDKAAEETETKQVRASSWLHVQTKLRVQSMTASVFTRIMSIPSVVVEHGQLFLGVRPGLQNSIGVQPLPVTLGMHSTAPDMP